MSAVHPLHSICPYFAMFPPEFVQQYVLAYTEPGEIVFDPFSGRGTTIFESLLLGRPAYGTDINPVAACVSGAKADPPAPQNVRRRIVELARKFDHTSVEVNLDEPFFEYCFSIGTLKQILFLRSELNWTSRKVDRFVAAMALGCLHGESHKSANCFSNRMPRTISTKPAYSIRWWRRHGYKAPERDVFEILLNQVGFRFNQGIPKQAGRAKLADARLAGRVFVGLRRRVKLVLTSPPYLDTTDYGEDQWLRLWFLGGGQRPKGGLFPDGRHDVSSRYWAFLIEAWQGLENLLDDEATMAVRIGGGRLSVEDIETNLIAGVDSALQNFDIRLADRPRSTDIKNRQTNAFRPGTKGKRQEHDFVIRMRRRRPALRYSQKSSTSKNQMVSD